MSSENEPVRCACGATLLDGMDDSHVVVGDDEFRFRRTTDFVGCPSCGTLYNVRDLQPGLNQPLIENQVPVDDPLDELRKLAAELDTLSPELLDIDADETITDPDYA